MKFPMLDTWWLHNNTVEEIGNLEFCELPKLQILKLNGNRIRGVLPIVRMPGLMKLELNNNGIGGCGNLEKWETPMLMEMYLDNNQI